MSLARCIGVPDICPPAIRARNLTSSQDVSSSEQRKQIDIINRLNRQHLASRSGYSELEARIESYELAFRLQSTAPDALNINEEPNYIRDLYGLDPSSHTAPHYDDRDRQQYARGCLIARRLVERGVRFIQLFYSGWDSHSESNSMQLARCREIDQATSALLVDLKQRGLLDETLVVWGGEFGREPFEQGDNGGRNHNADGFLYWLAGAGVKGGTSHGETDDIGHKAAVNRHHVRDLHATILHLMGLDHEALSYLFGGIEQRMTGPSEAGVIHGVVA